MRKWITILAAALVLGLTTTARAGTLDDVTEGTLRVAGQQGQRSLEFPLRHTAVEAQITGLVARVSVSQEFGNPYDNPLEAVYVFPLPNNAAVNDMTMRIGDRTIRADIQTREAARETYEAARAAGQRAALLEQERPNIFTQSVANITPGDRIVVEITYVQDLTYDHGAYEWNFPMVVGPRYIPGAALPDPPLGGGWAPDTNRVPDASRITPPVLRPEERSGHDISLHVMLDAGVPIQDLRCPSHEVVAEREGEARADVRLHPGDSIPNKDFILRYDVAGEAPEAAFLPYRGKEGGFFTLMVQPKADYTPGEITAKEMVFVVDRSGSMSGDPIEKCKEAMRRCVKGMNGADTFQIIGFSTGATLFRPAPVPNTSENVAAALRYVDEMVGGGGTEMLEGIRAALDYPADPERMRIVFFMTDGYIGNETEIFRAVEERLGGARLFSFGVGSSVNHYLLDGLAKVGRGDVQYVRPDEETEACVARFYDRIARPYLTDIRLEGEGVELLDLYPQRIPDLFSAQPVIVHGRFDKPGSGTVRVSGKVAGKPWSTAIPVVLPSAEEGNPALASLWARKRMGELMDSMYGGEKPETVAEITNLALEFRLMSPYTSFVAVEEKVVNEGGQLRTVQVPVPMPEGVSYEGVFGAEGAMPSSKGGGGFGGGGFGARGVAGPAGAPAGASLGLAESMDYERVGGLLGVRSWIGVLTEETDELREGAYYGLCTGLAAASQVLTMPGEAPRLVSEPEIPALAAPEGDVRCLVVVADDLTEVRATLLAEYAGAGRFLLLEAGDDAVAGLGSAGLEARALPADHALVTGGGQGYELGEVTGLRGLYREGELVGIVLPSATLESLGSGVTEANREAAKLLINVLSYAARETAVEE